MIDQRHLFVRFLVVGVLNSAFGYGCFALLVFAGLHYSVALFSATMLGVLFNFKTVGLMVFKSNNNRLLFRFVAVYAIVYATNVLGIKMFSQIGAGIYVGGALMLLPAAILAYVLNKRFVFNA